MSARPPRPASLGLLTFMCDVAGVVQLKRDKVYFGYYAPADEVYAEFDCECHRQHHVVLRDFYGRQDGGVA